MSFRSVVESSEKNNPIDERIADLANAVGNAVLVLDTDIDAGCFVDVVASLGEIGHQDTLSLVLNSPGGSIEFAFRIAKAVREKCHHLDVVVPAQAKSAATLIALAADRILFGQFGELGPLDPQVADLTSGGDFKSPLEIVKGLEFLRTYYIETFDVLIRFLLPRAGMDIAHTFDHATSLLSPIADPLYRLVNYRELGEASRHLAVSQEYAEKSMRRWSPLDDAAIESIVRQLVWEYPDHGYIIDIDEAHGIGLTNVAELDPDLESLSLAVITEQESFVKAALPENDGQAKYGDDSALLPGGEHENNYGTSCEE